jgi:hypothetical protein
LLIFFLTSWASEGGGTREKGRGTGEEKEEGHREKDV